MKIIITMDIWKVKCLMAKAWNTKYNEDLPIGDFKPESCNLEDFYNAFQSDLSGFKVEDFQKIEIQK